MTTQTDKEIHLETGRVFATISNERASREQVGRELHINIMSADKKLLWFIDIEERDGKLCLDVSDGEDIRRVEYLFQDEKIRGQESERHICTFNACKNLACEESGYDICKKHFKQGINN